MRLARLHSQTKEGAGAVTPRPGRYRYSARLQPPRGLSRLCALPNKLAKDAPRNVFRNAWETVVL